MLRSVGESVDGAIYKVSPDGTEKMVGYWDATKNKTGGFEQPKEKKCLYLSLIKKMLKLMLMNL